MDWMDGLMAFLAVMQLLCKKKTFLNITGEIERQQITTTSLICGGGVGLTDCLAITYVVHTFH